VDEDEGEDEDEDEDGSVGCSRCGETFKSGRDAADVTMHEMK
jgi:hypothetical protein